MKFKIKQPQQLQDGRITLTEVDIDKLDIQYYSVISIDGSTSNTGIAIMRESDGALLYLMNVEREKDESPVRYKVQLKRLIEKLFRKHRYINKTFYEEPVVANISSVKNLFMLRTFIEEIIIENEPDFNYISNTEVSNSRWKKVVLMPDKIPVGTDKQKKAIRDRMVKYLPFLYAATQDEVDAVGLGWAACTYIKNGQDPESLESKSKTKPFKYKVLFIGAEDDEGMLDEFTSAYNGPSNIVENGITFVNLNGYESFEKSLYNKMGNEDKIVVLKFKSKHYGNLILKHRIGNLAAQFPYLYAVVWRVTRK